MSSILTSRAAGNAIRPYVVTKACPPCAYKCISTGTPIFFGLPSLTDRDADANDMLDCFIGVAPAEHAVVMVNARLPRQSALLTDRISSASISRSMAAIVILPTISSAWVW